MFDWRQVIYHSVPPRDCSVHSLTGSQLRLTSLHASVTEITKTTHSPSHAQLPSDWDWLLLARSTWRKTANMAACKYASQHKTLKPPFPPHPPRTEFWQDSGASRGTGSAYIEGYLLLAVQYAAPWESSPQNSAAAACTGLAFRSPPIVHLYSACIQVAGKEGPLFARG